MRSVIRILMTRTLLMAQPTLTLAINMEGIHTDKILGMIRECHRVVLMDKPQGPAIRPIPITAGIRPAIPMPIRKGKAPPIPTIPTRAIPKANPMANRIREAIRLIPITAGIPRRVKKVEPSAKIRTRDTRPILIMAIIHPAIPINTVRHRVESRHTIPIWVAPAIHPPLIRNREDKTFTINMVVEDIQDNQLPPHSKAGMIRINPTSSLPRNNQPMNNKKQSFI